VASSDYCFFFLILFRKQSDQVPLSAFQSDWLGASEEAKKSLIIFMANAQRPLKISALNLFDLSLDTFLKVNVCIFFGRRYQMHRFLHSFAFIKYVIFESVQKP
jgi:hypothetical protein